LAARYGKVYHRMCIWDDDIIKGGGVIARHGRSLRSRVCR
jgi:hypothetical protein